MRARGRGEAFLVWAVFVLAGFGTAAAAPLDLGNPQAAAALQAADMTPEQAAAALKARGITEDQVRERLGGAAELPADMASPVAADTVEAEPERVEQAPREIVEGTPGDAEEELLPFGYSLFENSPESYRQPAMGPVDPEYPLGPGDTIVLDVWGDTVFRLERELDLEGGVNLPDVGRVVLAGMTLDDARGSLRRRLSRVYSGFAKNEEKATSFLSVTLGDLRVIRVFVVGRARRPGGYDLSAASTVFHSLFFAGGPSEGGSLRDVRVVRSGKEVARLDVYQYLRTGMRDGDIRLENDDTVFIPPTGPRVAVFGQVREPGLYEMLPGETLADLVEMSGGFTERSFEGRIQIERILSLEEQESSLSDRKVLDLGWQDARSVALKDGDSVEVFEIPDRLRNYVELQGEVRRPGRYEWREGSRLSDVLKQAGGLLETAVLERAEIIRTFEDQRREQVAVDLGKVLGGDEQRDLRMQPRDIVRVHSIWQLQDRDQVVIHGAVREPGPFELRDKMTLRDLLLQAGGLRENAYAETVEISRVRPGEGTGTETAEVFQVPLGEDYLTNAGADLQLEPWDNVFVREIPNWELQRNVIIGGEVRFPGSYTLTNPRETLSDVIERAGGLKETAYPGGFSLVRRKEGIGRIALDLEEALKRPGSSDDLVLFHGDSLFIPEEPKTVTVTGEVGWPTSLLYESGKSIGDYVSRAGGTTEAADSDHIRIVYSTGAAARVKHFWFDPEVRPGSTIHVPPKEEGAGIQWGAVFRDTAQILASTATMILVLDRVSN
ncbi:SLBB domain-containing protein [bacterium]|nr:SLBB domain-containing protein [bacterium]